MDNVERRRLMWLVILRTHRELYERYGQVIEGARRSDVRLWLGVAHAQYSGNPHSVSSLADASSRSRASVKRWADRMERAGVINTARRDRRRVLMLNPAFEKRHGRIADEVIDSVMPLVKRLSEECR